MFRSRLRGLRAFAATAILATTAVVVSSAPAQAVPNWTTITGQPGDAIVLACKRAVESPYGPLWEINIAALSSPDRVASARVSVTRNGQWVNGVNVEARNGEWKTGITYASRILPDLVGGTAGTGIVSTGEGAGGDFGPYSGSQLATCA